MGGDKDDEAPPPPAAPPACEQCEDTGVYDAGDESFGESWRRCDCGVVPTIDEDDK